MHGSALSVAASETPVDETRDGGPDFVVGRARDEFGRPAPGRIGLPDDRPLVAGSELLPGRTVARDLDVVFAFAGTGDIEGGLHLHERIHPHTECLLDT